MNKDEMNMEKNIKKRLDEFYSSSEIFYDNLVSLQFLFADDCDLVIEIKESIKKINSLRISITKKDKEILKKR